MADADADAVLAKLRATAEALQAPAAPAIEPVTAVEVVAMPVPRSWVFRIQRDDLGRIASILAEPVTS